MPDSPQGPRLIRVNLGGEGEVSDAINVQPGRIGGLTGPARQHALEVARKTGQPVVQASGDRLPFADSCVDEIITNNVPIDAPPFTYFGPSFTSAEILRILKPGGRWTGVSAP